MLGRSTFRASIYQEEKKLAFECFETGAPGADWDTRFVAAPALRGCLDKDVISLPGSRSVLVCSPR